MDGKIATVKWVARSDGVIQGKCNGFDIFIHRRYQERGWDVSVTPIDGTRFLSARMDANNVPSLKIAKYAAVQLVDAFAKIVAEHEKRA